MSEERLIKKAVKEIDAEIQDALGNMGNEYIDFTELDFEVVSNHLKTANEWIKAILAD